MINYELAFWVVAKIVVVLISPGGVVVPWAGTTFYMSCRLFLDLLSSVVVMSLCHFSGQVQLPTTGNVWMTNYLLTSLLDLQEVFNFYSYNRFVLCTLI